jgi:hypothetical protein
MSGGLKGSPFSFRGKGGPPKNRLAGVTSHGPLTNGE